MLAEQEVRGSIPGLAATISEIGYLLLQSRDLAEIPLKRRKSSIQPTNHNGHQSRLHVFWRLNRDQLGICKQNSSLFLRWFKIMEKTGQNTPTIIHPIQGIQVPTLNWDLIHRGPAVNIMLCTICTKLFMALIKRCSKSSYRNVCLLCQVSIENRFP